MTTANNSRQQKEIFIPLPTNKCFLIIFYYLLDKIVSVIVLNPFFQIKSHLFIFGYNQFMILYADM